MTTQEKNNVRSKVTKKRTLKGMVVSDKMKNTAVVSVRSLVKHPRYGKYMKSEKRYKAHNEGNSWKTGDNVVIEECRPMSRDKHFKIISGNAKAIEIVN